MNPAAAMTRVMAWLLVIAVAAAVGGGATYLVVLGWPFTAPLVAALLVAMLVGLARA